VSSMSIVSMVAVHLPGLVVLGIGGILLAVRLARQPETAYWLALGGVLILGLTNVLGLVVSIGVPMWASRAAGSGSHVSTFYQIYGPIASLVAAAGTACLIAAALMRPAPRYVLPTDVPPPPAREAKP